jgi:hypothetical protein
MLNTTPVILTQQSSQPHQLRGQSQEEWDRRYHRNLKSMFNVYMIKI